jgi:uncharacterized lipoprotein YmbA
LRERVYVNSYICWCCASIANVIFSVYKVVTYLTRLETRTKESNMYASHWVLKPKGEMKVKQACLLIHDP